jgi:hypothetical protein
MVAFGIQRPGQNLTVSRTSKKDGIMGYGLVGILVIILLVVLIVYFVRRA